MCFLSCIASFRRFTSCFSLNIVVNQCNTDRFKTEVKDFAPLTLIIMIADCKNILQLLYVVIGNTISNCSPSTVTDANVILHVLSQAKEGKVPDLSLGLTIPPLSSSTNGHYLLCFLATCSPIYVLYV